MEAGVDVVSFGGTDGDACRGSDFLDPPKRGNSEAAGKRGAIVFQHVSVAQMRRA